MCAVFIKKLPQGLYNVDELQIRTKGMKIIDKDLLSEKQHNALVDFILKSHEGIKIKSTISR